MLSTELKTPIEFNEFFDSGFEESSSPFLKPLGRQWAYQLPLRSSLFAAALLIIAFGLHFVPQALPLAYLLLICVYFIAGVPSLIESINDLLQLQINIDVLMTLAAFASAFIGSPFEGALLLVLFAISGSMEESVEAKAKGAISSLYKLSPSKAWVFENGLILPRSVKEISVGTHILIKAGEVVPLDGIVVEGTSSVNLVHLTGESLPVRKQLNDVVPAGANNLDGSLTLEVTHTNTDSTLSKIIQLVTDAQEARPRIQRWFDAMSQRYATTIILLSVFFALTLPFVWNIPFLGIEGSVYRALAFLIAASPCALIIAIPIAYLSAVSVCARRGILIKGGMTLDALAKCHILAFDKTGTLTTGNLRCTAFRALAGPQIVDKTTALSIAQAMEKNALHPIAKAIEAYSEEQQIPQVKTEDFRAVAGYGIEATAIVKDARIPAYIGNPDYILPKLTENTRLEIENEIQIVQERGDLIAVLLVGEELFLFTFDDTPRPNIAETLKHLKSSRIEEIVMLTGDHAQSAASMAKTIGIDKFYADLKPEDKLRIVSELSQNKGLAMVGDGINDAPALARATVGIGMGKVGSATAVAAADVVLLQDNLELLGWLFNKAHQTLAVVKQNLILAIGVIILATVPALLGWIPLWAAVVLHEGGTVLVGLNALRLLR